MMVDLGTGTTRVAITDIEGTVLAIKSFENIYYRDDAYSDAQFFLPEEWEREILRCCRELHDELPYVRVKAVSSAGAREAIVLIDKDGCAFYGLPSIDNRGRDFMSEIEGHEELYEKSGKWVTEDFCAAKVFGLKKLYPEMYSRIGCLISLSDWIGYIFTGVAVFEPSQACETQLYDIGEKCWSEMMCRRYGVDYSLLPPLVPAGSIQGHIKQEYISSFGMSAEAVFVVGGADTQAALYQTGIQPGDIAVVSGTTSPVVTLVEDKYYDPAQRVWTDVNLGANGYVIEMNPGVTGLNYQRIKSNICADISYEELEEYYAGKTEFGCTASLSSLLFYEQRSLRRGGFFMRSPLGSNIDRYDMAWAVLADIACSIYEQLYRLEELTGFNRSYALGCGGGFRSAALCQMVSDLSGLELRLKPGYEQATVNGLASIIRQALNEKVESEKSGETISFFPNSSSLIHRYHPVWLENRMSVN